jgi:hypothetical protein
MEQDRTPLMLFLSRNWRSKPLISHEVIINLIAATTSKTGLTVKSDLDSNPYPPEIKVSDRLLPVLRLSNEGDGPPTEGCGFCLIVFCPPMPNPMPSFLRVG